MGEDQAKAEYHPFQGPDGFDPDDAGEDCWDCGGEGGYAVCCEDSCPHIYGEEGCDDAACWRTCPTCCGEGVIA